VNGSGLSSKVRFQDPREVFDTASNKNFQQRCSKSEKRGIEKMPFSLPDHERRTKASGFVLTTALVTVLFCFVPIMISSRTKSQEIIVDDDPSCQYLQTATSCLVIGIVPMSDLLLEWINSSSFFNGIFSVFGIEQRNKRAQAAAFLDTSSVRMNLCERTMFVIGLVCLGGNQSFPVIYSSPLNSSWGIGFSEISGVFARSSILSLLCRISPTWTPLRAVGLTIFLQLFHVLFVATQLYPALKTLYVVVLVFFLGAILLSLILIVLTLYDMCKRQPTINTNGEEYGSVMNPDIVPSGMANDLSEQRLHNIVIIIHILAAFFPGVLQLLWDYFGTQWTGGSTTTIPLLSFIFYQFLPIECMI